MPPSNVTDEPIQTDPTQSPTEALNTPPSNVTDEPIQNNTGTATQSPTAEFTIPPSNVTDELTQNDTATQSPTAAYTVPPSNVTAEPIQNDTATQSPTAAYTVPPFNATAEPIQNDTATQSPTAAFIMPPSNVTNERIQNDTTTQSPTTSMVPSVSPIQDVITTAPALSLPDIPSASPSDSLTYTLLPSESLLPSELPSDQPSYSPSDQSSNSPSTEPSSVPSVCVTEISSSSIRACYNEHGDEIVISFKNCNAMSNDWIGLFDAKSVQNYALNEVGLYEDDADAWVRTCGNQACTGPTTIGTVTLGGSEGVGGWVKKGAYEVYIVRDDIGYAIGEQIIVEKDC